MEVLRGRLGGKLEDSLSKLVTLWDRIGISGDERSTYLDDLGNSMDEMLTDAVESTATHLRDLEEEVRAAEASIVEMNIKLGLGPVGAADTPPDSAPAVERREAVLAKLSETRDVHDARLAQLTELRDQLQGLWTALGEAPEEGFADLQADLSNARVTEFEGRLAGLRIVAAERREQMVELLGSAKTLLGSLKVEVTSGLDRQILGSLAGEPKTLASDAASECCVGLGSAALAAVTARHAELHALERERRDQLTVLGEAISKLYDRLDVCDEEQAAFAASVHGLGEDTITAGRQELSRLQGVLTAKLADMIELRREAIRALWEEMGTGPEQRRELEHLMAGEVSEEVLGSAEEAVATLAAQAAALRPILKSIERRAELLALRQCHAEQMRDPEYQALLTGRSRQARLALKTLEETEKAIKKELPRLTEALRRRMATWETQTGAAFLYHGQRFVDRMDDEEAEWEEAREREKRDKVAKKRAALQPSGARQGKARGALADRGNQDPLL